jgi:hypothetical protein
MTVFNIIDRLEKVRSKGANQWLACCPAHDDRSPSLSIKNDGDRVLLYCFSGCPTSDVLASIGLGYFDLFTNDISPQKKHKYRTKMDAESIAHEKLVLHIGWSDVANGRILTQADKDRLALAYSRIVKGGLHNGL